MRKLEIFKSYDEAICTQTGDTIPLSDEHLAALEMAGASPRYIDVDIAQNWVTYYFGSVERRDLACKILSMYGYTFEEVK